MRQNLSQEQIERVLTTGVIGQSLVVLPATHSTNTVAKALAAQGAPDGLVVVADEQTAGRGRLDRRWVAPPRTCILCSILFRPSLPLAKAHWLTMLCALASADAIQAVAGLKTSPKWPNDLIVQSPCPDARTPPWRKLAGLLTELGAVDDRLAFAVIGIGINVNVAPEALPALAPDATSILAEVGREIDRTELLGELLARVEQRYMVLRAGKSPHAEWAARLATLGQAVTVTTSEGMLDGIAEAVDGDGALLLRSPAGTLHRLLVGDVTLAHA